VNEGRLLLSAVLPAGKDWIDAFEALATPTIAALAAWFAWLAYRLEKKRRQDELFDRRYAFYQDFKEFWLSTGEGAPDGRPVDRLEILEWSDKARLLFDDTVADMISSLPEDGHVGGGGRVLEPALDSAFTTAIRIKP
jgi:hypothetical protein